MILLTSKYHAHLSHDNDLTAIQKYHTEPTPRIGGVAIYLSFAAIELFMHQLKLNDAYGIGLLLSSFLFFFIGAVEDITKRVTPGIRMACFILASLLAIYITHTLPVITYADCIWLEYLIHHYPIIGFILTLFCVVGLTNAYNIIDGYNGIASITALVNLFGIGVVGYLLVDTEIMRIALYFCAAILGFLLFNYPRGRIFLGDGGAYLLGFVIAVMSIYLVHVHLQMVSPYALLLINAYPITEIGFSVYRRKFLHKTRGMRPDRMHLHQLIYHRCVPYASCNRNAKVLPLMLYFIVPQVVLALIFYNNTLMCLILFAIYIIYYVISYFSLIKFKTIWFLK